MHISVNFMNLLTSNFFHLQAVFSIKKILILSITLFIFCVSSVIGQTDSTAVQDELVVAAYLSPPFCMKSGTGGVNGLSVDAWNQIVKELDKSSKLVGVSNVQDVLDGLADGTFDAAIGALTITPVREQQVDFSHAVNASGTGFAVATENKSKNFWSYWQPIFVSLLQLMAQLFIGVIFFGTLVYFIERTRAGHAYTERQINDWAEGIWWSIVTMSTVGYGDKIPFTRLGKAIAVTWIFASIVLVALFTAQASSIFTLAELNLHIETESDLRRSRVGVVENSSGEEFCKNRHIKSFRYASIEESLDELIAGDIDAVVSNIPVLQFAQQNKFQDKIAISPNILLRTNMGIALPNDSPLVEPINRILLEKVSEPAWRLNIEHYLGTY